MYRDLIRHSMEQLHLPTFGPVDLATIEAWMRVENPTLDHLTPEQFQHEVAVAAATAAIASEQENRALVTSLGLDQDVPLAVALVDAPANVACAWCGGSGVLATGKVCAECEGTGAIAVTP